MGQVPKYLKNGHPVYGGMICLSFYCEWGGWYVVRITPHLPELHGLKLPLRATRGSMHLSNQFALETEIGMEAHQHQTSEMNSDF